MELVQNRTFLHQTDGALNIRVEMAILAMAFPPPAATAERRVLPFRNFSLKRVFHILDDKYEGIKSRFLK
jgi:hypothetical protein